MAPKRKAAAPKAQEADETKPEVKKAKSKAGALKVGDNVSSVDTVLLTNDEKEVTLSEITKERGVVIFMYPRANTGETTAIHTARENIHFPI